MITNRNDMKLWWLSNCGMVIGIFLNGLAWYSIHGQIDISDVSCLGGQIQIGIGCNRLIRNIDRHKIPHSIGLVLQWSLV